MSADQVLCISESEKSQLKQILVLNYGKEIESCLKSLKSWIKKQPHLPQNEDDEILTRMLILNKISVEKTKSKLEFYYSGKNFLPEIFTNNYPLHPKMQQILDKSLFLPLPLLNESLERITIVGIPPNAEDFNTEDYHRLVFTTIELRLLYDMNNSEIFICKADQVSFAHLSKVSLRIIQNCLNYLVGAYSDRIKQVHFINLPPSAQTFLTMFKSLLKSKMADRIFVHKDLNSLYEFIAPKYLPNDFGGALKSTTELQADWRKFMESKNDWIKKRFELKSNEKLRKGNPVSSEIFGLQGSFQKLIID